MTAPSWACWLLRWAAPADAIDDVLGDLEEAHRERMSRHGRLRANVLTALEAVDMAAALVRRRVARRRFVRGRSDDSWLMRRSPIRHVSLIDFKLGLRMLVRYPGLTLVGGAAMAFAIAVGAGGFEVLKQLVDPVLPLEDGDRIVAIRHWDASAGHARAQSVHDLETWRDELESIEHVGAYRSVERNLIVPGGGAEPVFAAEISASAFALAGVRPLLGRYLAADDEEPGAPAVVVLSHETWRTRFDSDPNVTGRAVRLGRTAMTVVGVMPPDFAFPVAHHAWIPLRLSALDNEPGAGPSIAVFGRLAPGATLGQAQAEVATIGMRGAAGRAAAHQHLRPQVVKYAQSVVTLDVPPRFMPLFYAANMFFVMLLVLICANVALLMFARAATRESEIVVRTALGASRARIVTQLFTEALVLGSLAAIAGLAAAYVVLETWLTLTTIEMGGRLPFWFDDRISATTVIYAVALTVFGAAIAGILPALKMTGPGLDARLRRLSGGSGPAFGTVWTLVIATQVALTVAFPATAFFAHQYIVGAQALDSTLTADEYLSLRLDLDPEVIESEASARSARLIHASRSDAPVSAGDEFQANLDATYREWVRRLADEPGVRAVTFADRLPGTHHPSTPVEIDGRMSAAPTSERQRVGTAHIDIAFFDVLETPIVAGRGFHAADLAGDARSVIVNESFVARVLDGRNAVGQRMRYVPRGGEPGPWYEIIGVARDLGMLDDVSRGAGTYHPAAPGTVSPMHIALHVRGDPVAHTSRLRALAAAVDPGLRLHDVMPLAEAGATMWLETAFIFRLLVAISAIALLLSLAGIYAVMSFAVSRRTREIGVRLALGASARVVTTAIFARPLRQVAAGILAGSALTAALALAVAQAITPAGVVLVIAYAALMMGICMLACAVPTRRALQIQPSEALRSNA